jgi:hypothetical protein
MSIGAMMRQQVKVLLSLFVGKKVNGGCVTGMELYDFPAIFLDEWISKK